MLLLLSALSAQAEPAGDVACEAAYVARTLPLWARPTCP
jgi:hypothetical protein